MQTILLVEDNEMNRDMLARRLTRKDFSVITAEDGQQGIDYAIEQQPALILMDLSLPVVDGWEATRQLKANIATKHIPIIVLTAHAMKADEEKAFQAGCDDFDTKPVMLERLLEKMAKALTSE